MDLADFTASSSIDIDAEPEKIYTFVAELSRMGEISPECTGGTWENEARGPGALFVGSNTAGDRTWERTIRVTSAQSPHEFAFENAGGVPIAADDQPVARWAYRFTPVGTGTRVEESWELLDSPAIERLGEERLIRRETNQAGIEQTLANLKKLLEQ